MRRRKTAWLIALILLCTLCLSACQESMEAKYERAQRLLTEDRYFEATALFDEISTYADSSKMSMYAKAIAVAEDGQYDTALSSFRALGDFKDSPMMITYYTGRQYESQADSSNWSLWITAAEYYDMVSYFLDSRARADACRQSVYDEAVRLAGNGELARLNYPIWCQQNSRCPVCGAKVTQPETGRRKRFCSGRCRTRYYRMKKDLEE